MSVMICESSSSALHTSWDLYFLTQDECFEDIIFCCIFCETIVWLPGLACFFLLCLLQLQSFAAKSVKRWFIWVESALQPPRQNRVCRKMSRERPFSVANLQWYIRGVLCTSIWLMNSIMIQHAGQRHDWSRHHPTAAIGPGQQGSALMECHHCCHRAVMGPPVCFRIYYL